MEIPTKWTRTISNKKTIRFIGSVTLLLTLFYCFISVEIFAGEIHDAALKGDLKTVNALIKENQELVFEKNIEDNNMQPLHYAAVSGSIETVEYLISKGAKIDVVNVYGETPLYLASENRNLEIVKILVKNGADVNKKNSKGISVLDAGCDVDVVIYLLHKGAKLRKGYISEALRRRDWKGIGFVLKHSRDLQLKILFILFFITLIIVIPFLIISRRKQNKAG